MKTRCTGCYGAGERPCSNPVHDEGGEGGEDCPDCFGEEKVTCSLCGGRGTLASDS